MKKLFILLSMLCLALSPVFAAKSAIVGTWYILNPDRECVYYKFTEDNKCSKWIEYSHYETGVLTTEQIFTDVPYTFDEENMIIIVQEKEDFSWHWELDCIEADRFVVKGDWISYYLVQEDPSSVKNITLKHGESVYNINGAKMVRDGNNQMVIKDGKKYLNKE